jgi:hypothetical protein
MDIHKVALQTSGCQRTSVQECGAETCVTLNQSLEFSFVHSAADTHGISEVRLGIAELKDTDAIAPP